MTYVFSVFYGMDDVVHRMAHTAARFADCGRRRTSSDDIIYRDQQAYRPKVVSCLLCLAAR